MVYRTSLLVAVTVAFVVTEPVFAGTRYYVKKDGGTSGSCNSWTNACTLPYALSLASSGDVLWVKKDPSNQPYAPIELKSGVQIIGGFAGTETQASQSNPSTNVTTIDGGSQSQCVTSNGNSSTTVLRGFTITNCKNGDSDDWDDGGGVVLIGSSALFVRCVFEANVAERFGGAASMRGAGSPQFINCIFRNNGSGSSGSAKDTSVKPLAGGAVYVNGSSPTFVNCLFYDNRAGEGAAVAVRAGAPVFVNCTLVKNYAKIGYGGGLHDQYGKAAARNCIFWDNTSIKGGDQVFNDAASTPITYSDVEDGWSGTGNINSDPVFVNPSSNDYKLQCDSPCRDAGINSNPALPDDWGDLDWDTVTSEAIPRDLANVQRVYAVVEMGAYELNACPE